jgi:serine/threonine protein kinase
VQELTESNCPFVIKAYGTTQDDENLYFITEFVPGGELYSFLQEYGVLPEEQARFYAGQMVLALRHMHEQHNMVYRDIKPENMLLDRDGYVERIGSDQARPGHAAPNADAHCVHAQIHQAH